MDISTICLEWNQKLINSDSIKLSIDQLMLRLNKNQIKSRIHMLLGKNKKTMMYSAPVFFECLRGWLQDI